jgi:hypothetical protein
MAGISGSLEVLPILLFSALAAACSFCRGRWAG